MGFVGDDGEYTGFDLDLAKEVAKRLGLEYKAQPIAWDSKDMELESGNIDCIWNGFTITGREDDYNKSERQGEQQRDHKDLRTDQHTASELSDHLPDCHFTHTIPFPRKSTVLASRKATQS